jgi:hypothetical protein
MNTTNLFVELVVIGVGTLLALMLTIMSIFGYEWISWEKITSSTMLIPLVSITYLLGIVIDRIADSIYNNWSKKLRLKTFATNEEYHEALTYVYNFASERIVSLFIYGRSRLRISRAWSLNCIFLAITIPIFVWIRSPQFSSNTQILITIVSTIVFGLGTLASTFTWRELTINDYKRLAETSSILKSKLQN